MSGDRQGRAGGVFAEALARAPAERWAFVAEACGGNAELRREVEGMLAHHEVVPDEFMCVPDSGRVMGAGDGPDPRIGTRIGGYLIKDVIAAGGMGTVYLAEQEKPRRDVALKVMRAGIASRSALRRFEYESQILARLRHPNIAQVYEAGTSVESRAVPRPVDAVDRPEDGPARLGDGSALGGVPYFVMEYIPAARRITQYAEENTLGTRGRLALFAQVCDAVHHGHQKGIIHRDLKPANILVADEQSRDREGAVGEHAKKPLADARGSDLAPHAQVKVIDFGVARSTDSDMAITTLHTDVGQIIGTLQYMSPEQCEADPDELDTRSDVYALGVVLYELLCGRLPYDVKSRGLASVVRIICEKLPVRPSIVDKRLRGDLEMIVLKALKKDREQRYQSAADLAQDIRRYLNGEPIEARPPTAWTRGVRWVARHQVISTAVVCFAITATSLTATVITAWYYKTRPYEIVRYRSGERVEAGDGQHSDVVRLMSLSGNILHEWGGMSGAIAFSGMVEHPSEFGGGKMCVIAYSLVAANDLRGALCAYEFDGDREVPVWSRRIETEDILPQLRKKRDFVGTQFGISYGRIANVFPGLDHPGEEVVVIFHNEFSQRIIRIYDLDGTLLYQVWHEGSVGQPYWMSGARLLVFAGDNALRNWDGRGNLLKDALNPLVVFALRPEPAHINDTNFLNDPDFLPHVSGDDPESPIWYKYLSQGEKYLTHADSFAPTLVRPTGRDPGRCVGLNLRFKKARAASIGLAIDEFGEDVPASRSLSDAYKVDQRSGSPKLPNPNTIQLKDWPPQEQTSQRAVEPSVPQDGLP